MNNLIDYVPVCTRSDFLTLLLDEMNDLWGTLNSSSDEFLTKLKPNNTTEEIAKLLLSGIGFYQKELQDEITAIREFRIYLNALIGVIRKRGLPEVLESTIYHVHGRPLFWTDYFRNRAVLPDDVDGYETIVGQFLYPQDGILSDQEDSILPENLFKIYYQKNPSKDEDILLYLIENELRPANERIQLYALPYVWNWKYGGADWKIYGTDVAFEQDDDDRWKLKLQHAHAYVEGAESLQDYSLSCLFNPHADAEVRIYVYKRSSGDDEIFLKIANGGVVSLWKTVGGAETIIGISSETALLGELNSASIGVSTVDATTISLDVCLNDDLLFSEPAVTVNAEGTQGYFGFNSRTASSYFYEGFILDSTVTTTIIPS